MKTGLIFLVIAVALFLAYWLTRGVKDNLPWARYRDGVITAFPAMKPEFAKGASDAQLKTLQANFAHILPPSFVSMLRNTNGGTGRHNANGIFFGSELMSVDRILSELESWQQIIDSGLEGFTDPYHSFPSDTIQPVYVDPNWLPFVADGAGNFIALDYNPGPNGKVGQVISFGADEIELLQLAPSFPEFLELMRGLLQHPQVKYDPEKPRFALPVYFVDAVKKLHKTIAEEDAAL